MEKGAARQKEGLRGRDSSGGPSEGPEGPQKGPRRQLTEKGPISGAMGPISRTVGTVSRALGPAVAPGPPSGAPNPHADSWLQRMLGLVLKASDLRVSLTEAIPVTVLLLQRYMAEEPPPVPNAPCPAYYYYDVTVTDGTYQEKCLLAPQLNGLVQRNGLGAGRQIKITQCSYMYNERSLSPGFVCIEELEILEGVSVFAGLPSQLRICHVKTMLPLKGSRKHYLPLWNNDDPFGEMWVARKPLREASLEEFKPTSISILAMTWESKLSFPPLRVRIIHKSRLRYFGKPKTKLDVPYQAYFDVADQSGMVLMVLWGSLCPEWYHSMKIGTVLLLEKYAVKKSLSSKIQSSPEDLHMKRFSSIEIALNVRDPPAKINIIPEHKIKPEWKLPEVEYQFVTRSELDKLAQNQFCDIIGLVQYVGRVERKKRKGCVDDFWTYRWVHVVDGTSEQPFIIELFSTSQPDIFEQIYPMTYLVCTQMRVEQNISENGSSTAYLTTSMKTQMFTSGWHKGQPYIKDPKVQNFIQWMRTQEEASYVDKVVIGGYHRFPPLPRTFAEYCKNMNEELVLISISEIEKEIDSLNYREQKHIAFQGIISAIRCVSCSSTSQDASGESPMQIEKSSSVGTSLSEQQQARESTSRQKSPSLEQQTIVTRSCVKRRISAVETTDHPPVTSQHSYLTRSTSKRRTLPNFSQDNSVANKDNAEVMETAQTHESNKEIADGSEKVHRQRMCHNSWESLLWTSVKENLAQHLNFSKIFPESFPCKFNYAHKEVLLKQYNLQAAKFQPEKCLASGEMSHFENACPLEYYQVAILGVNHDTAVEVALLNDSYLFQVKEASQNAAPSHKNGTTPCQETINQGGLFELLSLPDDFKAAALENQRVICILDVCPLDNEKTEVFLRKIYKITEVDVVNQT
ncbi:RPA-related protein RADX isoform X2 [Pantherophis guttatus]|uniref:RPA-related protein RADX isoform X2 n=1 Tax=Pantherophis guttatus TaxID=94885 RepID=A0A6P9DH77_PANGU|nr:RPA-related protein RADX isoform X2 [Pantherophis guttatus]